jgi:predicted ATP-binding protein involved in virulence
MKIRRVFLKNIRGFEELNMKLDGKSAVIIGDNGDGKSTFMRSLAMGLCDDSSASGLFRELQGDTVRRGHDSGRINVELFDSTGSFRTTTQIKSLETFERVQQELSGRSRTGRKYHVLTPVTFPWDRIFAVGYGAGIRVNGTADYDYYLTVDAVYPLFKYDVPLQNPELVVRRLIDAARRKRRGGEEAASKVLSSIKALLKAILQLDRQDQVELTRTAITVKGPWGRSALSSLGDGYRSTITWILDLMSWWFLRTTSTPGPGTPRAIRGVVLIDEIEQHLHPRWQRNVMRLLTDSFPQIQFIATTHSPLVASGCEGIAVHRLSQKAGRIEHRTASPFGWLAEDVYDMMGLETSRAQDFEILIEEYRRLDAKRLRSTLSKTEANRLAELRKRFRTLPGEDPVRLTLELRNLADRARKYRRKPS